MAKKLRGAAKELTKASFNRAAKRIEKLDTRMKKRQVPSGLRLIGEEIMLDVKAARPGAGVPVDTGVLRSTGRVEGPANDEVTLSFGGAAASYALEQHENLEIRHRIGEARYLVRGIQRWQRDGASVKRAMAHLAKAIDAVAQG